MDLMKCCRTCMSMENLRPIFDLPNESKRYSSLLLTVTGVKIEIHDDLPHFMCRNCMDLVNRFTHFRSQCQTSLTTLKNINNVLKHNTAPISTFESNLDHENAYEMEEYDMSVEEVLKKEINIDFSNYMHPRRVKLQYAAPDVDMEEDEVEKGLEVLLECKYCHKMLNSKMSLNNHSRIHIMSRKIICEHCGQRFMSKRRLLMHCRSKHGYEKTDKCSYCDYRGCSAELVKIHERVHTGERPYVCELCGAAFYRRSGHLQHLKHHLPRGIKTCPECPLLFRSPTAFRAHRARHALQRAALQDL